MRLKSKLMNLGFVQLSTTIVLWDVSRDPPLHSRVDVDTHWSSFSKLYIFGVLKNKQTRQDKNGLLFNFIVKGVRNGHDQ